MSGVDAMALFLQVERARARGDWIWLQAAGAGAEAGLRPAQAALASSPCPEGGGVVLASGGSSGGRSFCLQPWSHLDASASACAGWLQAIGLDPSDLLLLNPLPPHHVSGLMPWWRSRCWGAAHAVLPPEWMKQPEQLMQACRGLGDWGRKPALVSLVPTQLQRLMAHPAGRTGSRRWLWSGSVGLPCRGLSRRRHANGAFGLPLATAPRKRRRWWRRRRLSVFCAGNRGVVHRWRMWTCVWRLTAAFR